MESGEKDQARLESDTNMSGSWHELIAEKDFPEEGKFGQIWLALTIRRLSASHKLRLLSGSAFADRT
jgi:hypothetical protein